MAVQAVSTQEVLCTLKGGTFSDVTVKSSEVHKGVYTLVSVKVRSRLKMADKVCPFL